MKKSAGSPKRKQLFVDRNVQGMLLFRTAAYWLYCLLTLMLLTLCWRIVHSEPQPFTAHWDALQTDFAPVALGSLLLLPVVLIDVLRVSNRFTGPIFRMRQAVRQLADGQHVPTVTFREGDYWMNFASDFNALAQRMRDLEAKVAKLQSEQLEPVA